MYSWRIQCAPWAACWAHTQNRHVQVAPLGVYYVVWYIKLLFEVYETVNWSEMGKAIP